MSAVVNPSIPSPENCLLAGPGFVRPVILGESPSLYSVKTRAQTLTPPRADFPIFRGDGEFLSEPKPVTFYLAERGEAEARAALKTLFDDLQFATSLQLEDTLYWNLQGEGYGLSSYDPKSFLKRFDTWQINAVLQPRWPLPTSYPSLSEAQYRFYSFYSPFAMSEIPVYGDENYQAITPTRAIPLRVTDLVRGSAASFGPLIQPPGAVASFPTRAGPPLVTKVRMRVLVEEATAARSSRRVFWLAHELRSATRLERYPEGFNVALLPGENLSLASVQAEATTNPRYRFLELEFRSVRIPDFVFALVNLYTISAGGTALTLSAGGDPLSLT